MCLVELVGDEGQLSDQGSRFRSNIWDPLVDLSSCWCPGFSGGISELMVLRRQLDEGKQLWLLRQTVLALPLTGCATSGK